MSLLFSILKDKDHEPKKQKCGSVSPLAMFKCKVLPCKRLLMYPGTEPQLVNFTLLLNNRNWAIIATADQLSPFFHHNNWKLAKKRQESRQLCGRTLYSIMHFHAPKGTVSISQMILICLEMVQPEKGRVMGMGFCR